MTIANYNDLFNILRGEDGYLKRFNLDQQIPIFVQLAEAKFNRDFRTSWQLVSITGTATSDTITLPDDCLAVYKFTLENGGTFICDRPIKFITEREASHKRSEHSDINLYHNHLYYTLFNNTIELVNVGATTSAPVNYKLRYYQEIPGIVENSTNWILTKFPDLYVYSAALEAAPFLKDDKRIETWAMMRQSLIQQLFQLSDDRMTPQESLNEDWGTF